MNGKICSTCKKEKPLSEFGDNKSKKDGKQYYCKDCGRASDRKHYQSNPDRKGQIVEAKEKAKERNLDYILEYLSEHPCVDCGESNPVLLDFDHLGNKVNNVSCLVTYGLDTVKEEIAKCEVRCVKCHRLKTAKQFGWRKLKLMDL